MTNAEMKKALKTLGVKEADAKKVEKELDAEKLTAAVEKAGSPEEAIKAVAKACPSINAKELKKRYEFVSGQSAELNEAAKKLKKPMELNEGELEQVAGGSAVGDWFKNNWKGIVIGLAVGLVLGAITGGVGMLAAAGSAEAGSFGAALGTLAAQPLGAAFGGLLTTGVALTGSMGAAAVGIAAGAMVGGAAIGGAVGGFVSGN